MIAWYLAVALTALAVRRRRLDYRGRHHRRAILARLDAEWVAAIARMRPVLS
jgi:ribose 1,5-bisphosphokinase PhnN